MNVLENSCLKIQRTNIARGGAVEEGACKTYQPYVTMIPLVHSNCLITVVSIEEYVRLGKLKNLIVWICLDSVYLFLLSQNVKKCQKSIINMK